MEKHLTFSNPESFLTPFPSSLSIDQFQSDYHQTSQMPPFQGNFNSTELYSKAVDLNLPLYIVAYDILCCCTVLPGGVGTLNNYQILFLILNAAQNYANRKCK